MKIFAKFLAIQILISIFSFIAVMIFIPQVLTGIHGDFPQFIAFTIVVIIISLGISLLLSYITIVRPILILIKKTKLVSDGKFELISEIHSSDEIGMLAKSFNTMVEKINNNQIYLEHIVEQKTKELEDNLHEIERQNNYLQDTKKAMVNLLEDTQMLREEISQDRDRLKTTISSISDALFVIDESFRIQIMNHSAEKMLGVNFKQIKEKPFFEITNLYQDEKLLDPNDRPIVKSLKEGLTIRHSLSDNYSLKTSSGFIPVAVTTSPLKFEGKITSAIAVYRDLTHEKQEQEIIEKSVSERTKELKEKTAALLEANKQVSDGWLRLEKEKARLTASIHSLTVGFIITDTNNKIITINQYAKNIFEIQKEIDNLSDLNQITKDHIDFEKLQLQMKEKETHVELHEAVFKNKFLHINIVPVTILQNGKNVYIGTVILIRDITERKILERSKDEFFSIASHELRTPLTAIRGNTAMIKDYFPEAIKDPQLTEMINDIHESSVRLIEIVNDFLDTSRLEQGRFEFKCDVFEVSKMINDCLKEYQTTGSQNKLYLRFDPPTTELPNVFADRNRTKQVMINLLGNAIKFTQNGGITVNAKVKDDSVEISVTDTGKGIPPDAQNLLFRKFQQAQHDLFTRDATRGTGLGLYISKLMIEGMGGRIYLVKTEEGKGTTFAFTLPLAQKA